MNLDVDGNQIIEEATHMTETTNGITYNNYKILTNIWENGDLKIIYITACDMKSAQADFNEAYGENSAIGPMTQMTWN